MTTFDCADPVARRAGIEAAAFAAEAGNLVVMPTDTVYGIGANAFNVAAVRNLLVAKGRGPDMPVPVLVGSWSTIDGLTMAVSPVARTLIEAFWPGGLSLVIEHAPSLSWDLGDSRGTVMVRMPLHPVALDLLRMVGPMAVSSANRSGMPPATTAAAAVDQLGEDVSRSTWTAGRRRSAWRPPWWISPERCRGCCARARCQLDRLREVIGELEAVS